MNADYRNVSSVTFYKDHTDEIRLAVPADHYSDLMDYDDDTFVIGNISRNGRQTHVGSMVVELGNTGSGTVLNYGNDGETATLITQSAFGFKTVFSAGAYGSYFLDLLDIGVPSFKNRTSYSAGSNISLNGVGADYDPIVVCLYKSGRRTDFCATKHDLIQATGGLVLNFGNDGELITVTGNGSDGFSVSSAVNVTITNLVNNTKGYAVRRIISNYSVPSGAILPVSSVKNMKNFIIVTVNQNGRCCGFYGIGTDLYDNSFGSVMNFGSDGYVCELSGNGESGLIVSSSSSGKMIVNMYELEFMPEEQSIGDLVFKNSFKDFHLVPAKRLGVNPPTPRYTNHLISGTSEVLDVTELAENGLHYSHRTGSWDFYIDHEQWPDWSTSFSIISGFLNGYKVLAILEEDPYRAYEGYVKVSSYSSGSSYSTFTIAYDFEYETALGFRKYPIKFIKSDGTYYDLEYTFSPGTEYVTNVEGVKVSAFAKRILLSIGLYNRKYVPIGRLIEFDGSQNRDSLQLISVYESGRFFGVSGSINELVDATASEVMNFGSDGTVAYYKGNEYSGITIGTDLSSIKGTYVSIKETESIAVYRKVSFSVGSWISLAGVSSQNSFLSVLVLSGGRYVSFISTARDLCENTNGTVYSFGNDGAVIVVTGNGSGSFKIEVNGFVISNVSISVYEIEATAVYSREQFSNGEAVSLAGIRDIDMVAVSASYNGRRLGFCVLKRDLLDCSEEKVFNVGADGHNTTIYGDGSQNLFINSEKLQNANWYVSVGYIS